MCNRTPHKHAAVIKEWADGAKIEFRQLQCEWRDLIVKNPAWHEDTEYRVKPEPKPDVVTYAHVVGVCEYRRPQVICSSSNNWNADSKPSYTRLANVKFTFDGETGKLKKAEVI